MKKTRRRNDRDLKISVIAGLEDGKPPAQIARKQNIYPSHQSRANGESADNP